MFQFGVQLDSKIVLNSASKLKLLNLILMPASNHYNEH